MFIDQLGWCVLFLDDSIMTNSSLPSTMRAAQVVSRGYGPENIKVNNVPLPQIQANDILIRVHAASCNHIDYKLARGMWSKRWGRSWSLEKTHHFIIADLLYLHPGIYLSNIFIGDLSIVWPIELPYTAGFDAAGEVVAVGADCKRIKVRWISIT